MTRIKSVAVIGAGPAGAIAADALAQERQFDVIRVFERREKAGGCWIQDPSDTVQKYPDLEKIAERRPDETIPVPSRLPAIVAYSRQYRFDETSIYPLLETNVSANAMCFSQEPFPEERSALNISRHGPNSPFRHWKVVERYVQDLLNRRGYQEFVSYNTTVELVQKDSNSGKWVVTLRQPLENRKEDRWWTESFDSVIVASGHYTVPFIPLTPGLAELESNFPGTVEHSKAWRDPEKYRGKRVVVVGASISGADISWTLAGFAEIPLIAARGKYHPYFSDYAFQHPHIQERPPITEIISNRDSDERTVRFADGSTLPKVDHIIFGTGYSWTLAFLPHVASTIRNNRVPNLYQHVFHQSDPTLTFVGATAAGFTFKVFEWQAVLAARFLAGRITLPPLGEQIMWEEQRIARKGDGVAFTGLYPDFEEYFEEVRTMAGPPTSDGKGRALPKWERWWEEDFEMGHQFRIAMWKRGNEKARDALQEKERKKSKKKSGDSSTAVLERTVVQDVDVHA